MAAETCLHGACETSDDESALLQSQNQNAEKPQVLGADGGDQEVANRIMEPDLLEVRSAHTSFISEASAAESAAAGGAAKAKSCSTFTCGTDWVHKPKNATCSDSLFCTSEQCCDRIGVCGAQFACPPVTHMPKSPFPACKGLFCTQAECCKLKPKGKCGYEGGIDVRAGVVAKAEALKPRVCPNHMKPKGANFTCLRDVCTMEECCDMTVYVFIKSTTAACPKDAAKGYDGTIKTVEECSAAAEEIGHMKLGDAPLILSWRKGDAMVPKVPALKGRPGVWGGNDGRSVPKHPCGCRLNKAYVADDAAGKKEGILMLYGNYYSKDNDLSAACDATAKASGKLADGKEYYGVFCKRTMMVTPTPAAPAAAAKPAAKPAAKLMAIKTKSKKAA